MPTLVDSRSNPIGYQTAAEAQAAASAAVAARAVAAPPSPADLLPEKQPEALSAIRGGNRFAEQVYGRPIPYVIGVGPVDGMPVYGGATQIVTTTTSVAEIPYTETFYPSNPLIGVTIPTFGVDYTTPPPTTVTHYTTSTTTSTSVENVVQAGYLLARNFDGLDYVLVQLTLNDVVVYDAAEGIAPANDYVFRNGLGTTAEALVVTQSGQQITNGSDIQVFVNNLKADTAATAKTVIAEASLTGLTDTAFTYLGDHPAWAGEVNGCYDDVLGIYYEIIPKTVLDANVWMIAYDLRTRAEIYRVILENAAAKSLASSFFGAEFWAWPLPGTNRIVIRMGDGSAVRMIMYDVNTGTEYGEWAEPSNAGHLATIEWESIVSFQSKFLMVGVSVDGSHFFYTGHYWYAVIDPTTGTITATELSRSDGISAIIAKGRVTEAFSSFFISIPNNGLYEAVYDGSDLVFNYLYDPSQAHEVTISISSPAVINWPANGLAANAAVTFEAFILPELITAGTTYYVKTIISADTFTVSTTPGGAAVNTVITGAGTITGKRLPNQIGGLWYDRSTDLIVITLANDFVVGEELRTLDPNTGAATFSTDPGVRLTNYQASFNRVFPSPGYAFFFKYNIGGDPDVYLFNISSKFLGLWATNVDPRSTRNVLFVQSHGAYYRSTADELALHEFKVAAFTPGYTDLQVVLTRIYTLAHWDPADLMFSGFAGTGLPGFLIDRDTNTQSPTDLLAQIFDFSYADIGSGMLFQKRPRGASFVADAVIPYADLIRVNGISINSTDEPDGRMPSTLSLGYISADSNYQQRSVSSVRPSGYFDVTDSSREMTISGSVVLFDDDAITLVHSRHYSILEFQGTHSFALPPKYARLTPGDVIQIPLDDDVLTIQLTKVALGKNGMVSCEAVDFQTDTATAVATQEAKPVVNFIPSYSSGSNYIDLDTALLNDADDLGGVSHRRYGALTGRGQPAWLGASKYEGDTVAALSSTVVQPNHPTSFVGRAINALAAPTTYFMTDEDNALTISVFNGTADLLASITHSEMMMGGNRCFLGSPGRWEIMAFRDVVDNGDNTLTLTGLVRGWRGTEVHCIDHKVGDQFYLYNAQTLHRQVYDHDHFGDVHWFQAVGLGADPRYGSPESHIIEGNAEKPYAVVNLAARVVAGDIHFSFDWRSRLQHPGILMGNDSTISGEATLSFEADIIIGSDVVRTLTATTNDIVYTAAEYTADFGGLPGSVHVDVAMISALVGRGYPNQAVLSL